MKPRPSISKRYLRDASTGHRRAALVAVLLAALILLAAIGLFFVSELDMLRPAPMTAAESQYVRARSAEAEAIEAARHARVDIDTAVAVIAARIDVADAQLAMGQLSAAARSLDNVLRDNPYSVRALLSRAQVHEAADEKYAAVDLYQQVLDYVGAHEPELRREALRGIGYNLAALGEGVRALDALTQAALILPESTTLHIAAGELALDLERWELAATHFYSVLRFSPQDPRALHHLAILERDHSDAASAALTALTEGTAYE